MKKTTEVAGQLYAHTLRNHVLSEILTRNPLYESCLLTAQIELDLTQSTTFRVEERCHPLAFYSTVQYCLSLLQRLWLAQENGAGSAAINARSFILKITF